MPLVSENCKLTVFHLSSSGSKSVCITTQATKIRSRPRFSLDYSQLKPKRSFILRLDVFSFSSGTDAPIVYVRAYRRHVASTVLVLKRFSGFTESSNNMRLTRAILVDTVEQR